MRKFVPLSLVAVALMAAQCANKIDTTQVQTEAAVNSDQRATTSTKTEGDAMVARGASSSEPVNGTTSGSSSDDAMMYTKDTMKNEGKGGTVDDRMGTGGSATNPPIQATTSASGSYNYSR